MSEKRVDPGGVVVGDFHVRLVPAGGTSDDLDTEQSRERARRAEDDAREAQHGGGAGREEGEGGRASAAADVDASIEEARERSAGGEDAQIWVRDPVTGAVVRVP